MRKSVPPVVASFRLGFPLSARAKARDWYPVYDMIDKSFASGYSEENLELLSSHIRLLR